MTPEDIGHALLTSWADWTVTSGHRCCLWYPGGMVKPRIGTITRTRAISPSTGLMPVRLKAVQRGINAMPRTTQAVIYSKYLIPGDDSLKWVDLSISRRTWYRQIAEARRAVGVAALRAGV